MPFASNHLKQQGKRLQSIQEFAASLTSMQIADDACSISKWGAITDTSIDPLVAVQTSEQHFRFMPGTEFSPRLYRGQTEFHETCVPTIFRDGISNVTRCFSIGKWIELSILMDHHPATLDLMEFRIGDLSFGLNIEALAQHYGFRTALMDFSRSRDVAMFFATCRHDRERDCYEPLRKGCAVLYIADLKGIIEYRKGSASFLPLGLEPLPRPEAQRALAVRLNPGENLNDMPWINYERVEITPELSQHYFDLFHGGKKLFPSNPFDDHVRSIQESLLLPLEVLSHGMELGLIPNHPRGVAGARSELLAAGYKVESNPIVVDPAMIQAAAQAWESEKVAYYDRIRFRGGADSVVLD